MTVFNIWSWLGRFGYFLLGWGARFHLSSSKRAYLLVESSSEILLTKNWFGRQSWHLPGGGVKKNESSMSAACRETAEELNFWVEPASLLPLSRGKWVSENKHFDYEIFWTQLPTKPKLKLKKPEILEAGWYNSSQLDGIDVPEEIKQAVEKLNQQIRKRSASGKI